MSSKKVNNIYQTSILLYSVKICEITYRWNKHYFPVVDLQFSSEDEFDEVPFAGDEHNELDTLDLGEIRDSGEVPADDDSQQAAEAMVQLGNVGFYVGEQQLLHQGK